MKFSSIESALIDLAQGKMLIVVDDEGRENEGDLVMAAQFSTPEDINFMITHGRGLVCAPMAKARAQSLGLELLTSSEGNSSPFQTPFTISLDYKGDKNTGISAHDRALTLRSLSDERVGAPQFQRPGHIFPLVAQDKGVFARDGHTEASVDLLKLAGLSPVAVICEILNEDGTMARVPKLMELAKKWNLKIITIKDLVKFRLENEKGGILPEVVTNMPTRHSTQAELGLFTDPKAKNLEHLAYIIKRDPKKLPLVRIHSECFTGDVFGSLRCDCGEQLNKSLKLIEEHGHGALIYLRQEGRGIGLSNKLRAYNLQDHQGKDTVEANEILGHAPDERSYLPAAMILHSLGLKKIRLITNNPHKSEELESWGIEISERLGLSSTVTPFNQKYLQTKIVRMRHLQDLFSTDQFLGSEK